MAGPAHVRRRRCARRRGLTHDLDHVAIEVPDFDAFLARMTSALGMVVRRVGALTSDPSRRIAMVSDSTGRKLEIVEGPAGGAAVGLLHVAWRVDDVDAEYSALLETGCTSVSAPRRLEAAKSRTATVADPEGAQIQLVTYDPDSPDA